VADLSEEIKCLARKYAHMQDWFFIGRGILFPVAMESALKFKEASYRHAEGLGAGSFKHGPISLISPELCTVTLLPSPVESERLYTAMLANVSEISARNGIVIGIGPKDIADTDIADFADYVPLACHDDLVADVCLQLVAGQLLAYYFARELGREIDQPRYLAKSVTVR
jgi:glucosamine--fructose-6-phosphate aminotransferase (isomerizing)